MAQARWVNPAGDDEDTKVVLSERLQPMTSRIERFVVNNGVPTYFVRSECGGIERTTGVKFEEFRKLHRKLSEEGGVLYAPSNAFPRALRKTRIGVRLTPAEIGEQCDALNHWLRLTVAAVDELPLDLQKEVRAFLGLEGGAPAWSTTTSSTSRGGLFGGSGRSRPTKKREAVYPLGDMTSLPGVTHRGRLDCRDATTGGWVSTHVILTHLSLLVFEPLEEGRPGRRVSGTPSKTDPAPSATVASTSGMPGNNRDPSPSLSDDGEIT